ncbi:MAG: class I SAM-dependent methyltransferase [Candidatus Micrarchaeota archaeon]|nr:class I SAM-dependent methyltransferase [Candidatus Micrarchaeota archaeon]
MDVYQKMAEHYDVIYGDNSDIDFYLQEAKNARGPVLEVACGTGRILLALLSNGIDIQGIDFSRDMLEVLKTNAKAQNLVPKIMLASMVDFKLDQKFNLIIVPYRSFLHMLSESDRKATLENFKSHLNEGGRLILHIYNPSDEDLSMVDEYHHFEQEDFIDNGKRYVLDWFLKYEKQNRIGNYKIKMSVEGEESEFSMQLYLIKQKEMNELLIKAGYKNIRDYCGFDYLPFDGECSEVVWIAER